MEGKKESLCTDDLLKQNIERYTKTVYRLAYSLVKDKYDADDIYQEVFLSYLKRKPSFADEEHAKAWFIRVTVNFCKNFWKSAWQRKTTAFSGQEEALGGKEADRELICQVKALPEKYRAVIHLFYYEDMTVEEIGRVLKRKPSTVRAQLTRARQRLREKLEEEM